MTALESSKQEVTRYQVLSEYLGGNTNYLRGHVSTVVLESDYDARGVLVLALKADIERLRAALRDAITDIEERARTGSGLEARLAYYRRCVGDADETTSGT